MENLKCCHCSNFLKPPVKLCNSGDVICSSCGEKYPECPVCKQKFSPISIKNFDNFLRDFKRECHGKLNGCQESLSSEEVSEHEEKCYYLKKTICHVLNCGETIYCCQYLNHFTQHPTFPHMYYNFKNLNLNFDVDNWKTLRTSLVVRDHQNGLFEVNINSTEEKLMLSVRYMGQKLYVSYFDLIITAISKKNKLECANRPLVFDLDENELWESANFTLMKEQAKNNFKRGIITLSVYKNSFIPMGNFPMENSSRNIFEGLAPTLSSSSNVKMFSSAPTAFKMPNQGLCFGAAPSNAPIKSQSFGTVAPEEFVQSQLGEESEVGDKFNIFG